MRFVAHARAKPALGCDNGKVISEPLSSHIQLRDGTLIRFIEWASVNESPGIPILLIHGLASNARLWDGPARCLTQMGHAVIAIDQRGHGLSDKPDFGYGMSDIAADVADMLTAPKLDEAAIERERAVILREAEEVAKQQEEVTSFRDLPLILVRYRRHRRHRLPMS